MIQIFNTMRQTKGLRFIYAVICLLLIADCNGKPQSPNTFQTVGCPMEYHHNIRSSQGAEVFSAVGAELASECYDNDETSPISRSPNEFFVYPTRKRICQPNGTWSGVPPACVRKNASIEAGYYQRYIPLTMSLCPTGECPQANETWQPIGRLHSSCSTNPPSSNSSFEYLQVYVEFEKHVHLSYMTFDLADNAGRITRPFKVEVNAHPEDVIRELTWESIEFLSSHYESVSADNSEGNSNTCAITELGAYAKNLLIRFFVEKTSESEASNTPLVLRWRQRPMFYGVINNESRGCPDRPLIPRSVNQTVVEEDDIMTVTYTCQPGYTMIDPKTKEISDGKIECYRDLEWAPYPFPICVPSSVYAAEEHADSLTNLGAQLNHLNSIDPMPEENDRNPASNTTILREVITTEQRDTDENDPMIFIIMGSFLGFGIAIGSIATLAFFKLKQRKDPEDLQRKTPNKFFYQRGFNTTAKGSSTEYETMSNSTDGSSNSRHVYDKIDERMSTFPFPSSKSSVFESSKHENVQAVLIKLLDEEDPHSASKVHRPGPSVVERTWDTVRMVPGQPRPNGPRWPGRLVAEINHVHSDRIGSRWRPLSMKTG